MRTLKSDPHDRPRTRWVLDVETDGLGEPGEGPPEQFLAVLYRDDGEQVAWGPSAYYGDAALTWSPTVALLQELIDAGEPVELWAHFGGAFDYRLVYDWLFRTKRAKGKILNVGSTVLVADLVVDDCHLRLCDSVRVLPGSLASIGESLGYPKLDWDHTTTRQVVATQVGADELLRYCRRDCEILWKALDRAERLAQGQGVKRLRTTMAATSTAAIRSTLTKRTVATSPIHVECRAPGDEWNGRDPLTAEDACYGGRVEIFGRLDCIDTFTGDTGWVRNVPAGFVYDLHSSYPAAMASGPLPWRYKGSVAQMAGLQRRGKPRLGFVDVTVRVPDDTAIPVLPWRHPKSGRLYFPTGTWRGAFVFEELCYAIDQGARIVSWHGAHEWRGSTAMRDFALSAWTERARATGFDRYWWKIWLNSAYGKLIEGREKQLIKIGVEDAENWTEQMDPSIGLVGRDVIYDPSFRHPIAGATILARGRIALHKGLVAAGFENLVYCDTDSVTSIARARLPLCVSCAAKYQSDADKLPCELGRWAHEHTFVAGMWLAPKLYRYFDVDRRDWVVRAKGFSGSRHGIADPGILDTLAAGGAVTYDRHKGFRECARVGGPYYDRVRVIKQLRTRAPKRRPDGSAWSVVELEERGV